MTEDQVLLLAMVGSVLKLFYQRMRLMLKALQTKLSVSSKRCCAWCDAVERNAFGELFYRADTANVDFHEGGEVLCEDCVSYRRAQFAKERQQKRLARFGAAAETPSTQNQTERKAGIEL